MTSFWTRINPYRQIREIKKQLKIAKDGLTRAFHGTRGLAAMEEVFPQWKWEYQQLEYLGLNCDITRAIFIRLKQETFREGLNLADATKDTDQESKAEAYGEKTSTDDLKKDLLLFFENVNENDQSLLQVCKEIEDDHNMFDDGWMQFLNEYSFTPQGAFIYQEHPVTKENIPVYTVQQIKRVHPAYMGLVINNEDRPGFNNTGQECLVCPNHRETLVEAKEGEGANCPKCGFECRRAHYVHNFDGTKRYFYLEEFEHQKMYTSGKRLGYPPLLTIWMKARTLLWKDKYIMDNYEKQRSPKQILAFSTSNPDSAQKAWEAMLAGMRDNPNMPGILTIPRKSQDKGKEILHLLDLQKTLEEMQYTENYNKIRRDIGGFYGVTPIFQSDTEGTGGINKEGMQFAVTNRATEDHQSIWNNHYLAAVIYHMRVVGLTLTLHPAEKQDEMARTTRIKASLEAGQIAVDLGLEVEWDDEQQDIVIHKGPMEKQTFPDPFTDTTPEDEEGTQNNDTPEDEPAGTPEPDNQKDAAKGKRGKKRP